MAKNEYICDCNAIHQDLVDEVLMKIPNHEIFDSLANFYKILGDNTRCKILYALSINEMCVCDLANVLCMSKSAISHQLSKLKETEIVKWEKRGKEVYYMLDDNHISDLFDIGLKHMIHKKGDK